MKVVVASPEEDCAAHRALVEEGTEHELLLCEGDFDYGEHLARLWKEGEGFILFEWDVVPRPGVVARLMSCRKQWCAWPYDDPRPGHDEPGLSLGCMKFGTRLLRKYPDLPEYWQGAKWESVEGNVRAGLNQQVGPYPHMHGGGR